MNRTFIIDKQRDFNDFLKYVQDLSIDGYSMSIKCEPVKGIEGPTAEYTIRTYKSEKMRNYQEV